MCTRPPLEEAGAPAARLPSPPRPRQNSGTLAVNQLPAFPETLASRWPRDGGEKERERGGVGVRGIRRKRKSERREEEIDRRKVWKEEDVRAVLLHWFYLDKLSFSV